MNDIDYAAMSGQNEYQRARLPELNEVSLNGDGDVAELEPGKFERKGGFFRKRMLAARRNRDEKPEEVNLGTHVSVVFLKIRRKMAERADKGEIVRSTGEHDSPYSEVTLTEKATRQSETGVAREIREKYKGLRTTQVVYALLFSEAAEPELVRLMVRGSSLASNAKAADVMTFYDYVASFAKGEHMWEYRTELRPVLEQGAKSYFAIKFERGEKVDEATAELAKAKLKEVYDACLVVEEARKARASIERESPAPSADPAKVADDFDAAFDAALGGGAQPPAADIDPDDITFD